MHELYYKKKKGGKFEGETKAENKAKQIPPNSICILLQLII